MKLEIILDAEAYDFKPCPWCGSTSFSLTQSRWIPRKTGEKLDFVRVALTDPEITHTVGHMCRARALTTVEMSVDGYVEALVKRWNAAKR